jgi:hypothetical protein
MRLSESIDVPPSKCPYCNDTLDCAATVGPGPVTPLPGDATICLTCGEWLIFTPDSLRKPTPAEIALLESTERAVAIQQLVRRYIAERQQ